MTSPSLKLAHVLTLLCETYQFEHKHPEAVATAQKAVSTCQMVDPSSVEMADAEVAVADLATVDHNFTGAIQDYSSAPGIYLERHADALKVGYAFNKIGTIYYLNGDLKNSEQWFRNALETLKRGAPGSSEIAKTYEGLGNDADDSGDPDGAISFYNKSIAINERLSPGSMALAKNYNNLEIVLDEKNDLAGALEVQEKSRVILERIAPNSTFLADAYVGLGHLQYDKGNAQEAVAWYARAVDIYLLKAPDSPALAGIYDAIAGIRFDQGDLPLAENYFQKALVIYEEVRLNSIGTASCYMGLGNVARGRGDIDAAEIWLKKSGKAAHAFDMIASGARIVTGTASSAIVVLFGGGRRWRLVPKSQIRIQADSVQRISGSSPEKLKPLDRRIAKAMALSSDERLQGGAMVRGGAGLHGLAPSGTVLVAPSALSWKGRPEGDRVIAEVFHEGHSVFSRPASLESDRIDLPKGLLKPGESYRWKLSVYSGDDLLAIVPSAFEVEDSETTKALLNLKSSVDQGTTEPAVLAFVYDRLGIREDALAYYRVAYGKDRNPEWKARIDALSAGG